MIATKKARRLAAIVTLGLAAAALGGATAATAGSAPAASASKKAPPPKLVSINDFYFGPSSVTVKKGSSIKWVWSSANTQPHDVHLKQGPSGLKKKGSYSTPTATTNAQFTKKFETPGTYHFICTIHPTEMKLTVTVKK